MPHVMPELPPLETATAINLAQSASEHLASHHLSWGGLCGFAAVLKLLIFTGPALAMIGSNSFRVFIISYKCIFSVLRQGYGNKLVLAVLH